VNTVSELGYTPRLIDRYLSDLVATFSAVLVNGPRAAGKTTSARRVAASVVRLDRPAEAAGFLADPDAALRGRPEPLLLDEWQAVPEVLGAVKRSVDDDPRPGRFVLTGSVRADLEHNVWPGTGRLIRARMYGLAQREIVGGAALAGPSMLDKIAQRSADAFTLPATRPDLRDYIELAVRGGFPAAVLRTAPGSVDLWVDNYLEQLLTRDAQPAVAGRDSEKLVAYLQALSAMSAGIPEHKTIFDAAGVDAKTARTYDRLLEDLYIAEQIPAWSAVHLQRLIKSAKRYVVDTSIMSASLGVGVDTLLGSDDLLGRVIDTFVMAQLRPEVAISRQRTRLHHARTKGGREEVDIVAELPGGRLLGLEIKATASPKAADARHLRWLRAEQPERFAAGVVLHTGPDVITLDDDIFAVPICAFWG
jgi:predicted AAA+ superfamily ATPase